MQVGEKLGEGYKRVWRGVHLQGGRMRLRSEALQSWSVVCRVWCWCVMIFIAAPHSRLPQPRESRSIVAGEMRDKRLCQKDLTPGTRLGDVQYSRVPPWISS